MKRVTRIFAFAAVLSAAFCVTSCQNTPIGITADRDEVIFTWDGANSPEPVLISSAVDAVWEVSDIDGSWIRTSIDGAALNISADPNYSHDLRSGIVVVTTTNLRTPSSVIINVQQEPLVFENITVSFEAQPATSQTVQLPSLLDASWQVAVITGGGWFDAVLNGQDVIISAEPNTDPAPRSGELIMQTTNLVPQLTQRILVDQVAAAVPPVPSPVR